MVDDSADADYNPCAEETRLMPEPACETKIDELVTFDEIGPGAVCFHRKCQNPSSVLDAMLTMPDADANRLAIEGEPNFPIFSPDACKGLQSADCKRTRARIEGNGPDWDGGVQYKCRWHEWDEEPWHDPSTGYCAPPDLPHRLVLTAGEWRELTALSAEERDVPLFVHPDLGDTTPLAPPLSVRNRIQHGSIFDPPMVASEGGDLLVLQLTQKGVDTMRAVVAGESGPFHPEDDVFDLLQQMDQHRREAVEVYGNADRDIKGVAMVPRSSEAARKAIEEGYARERAPPASGIDGSCILTDAGNLYFQTHTRWGYGALSQLGGFRTFQFVEDNVLVLLLSSFDWPANIALTRNRKLNLTAIQGAQFTVTLEDFIQKLHEGSLDEIWRENDDFYLMQWRRWDGGSSNAFTISQPDMIRLWRKEQEEVRSNLESSNLDSLRWWQTEWTAFDWEVGVAAPPNLFYEATFQLEGSMVIRVQVHNLYKGQPLVYAWDDRHTETLMALNTLWGWRQGGAFPIEAAAEVDPSWTINPYIEHGDVRATVEALGAIRTGSRWQSMGSSEQLLAEAGINPHPFDSYEELVTSLLARGLIVPGSYGGTAQAAPFGAEVDPSTAFTFGGGPAH